MDDVFDPAARRSALWSEAPPPATVSAPAREALTAFRNEASPPDLQQHRAFCADVQRELGGRLLERHGVEMKEAKLGGVPVRIFQPKNGTSNSVLLNLHGGGFTVDAGSMTENASIAAYAECTVVATRYRLAPEHPFPAAVDDAEAVYRALTDDIAEDRIGLYGTSAGACLSVQLLVRLSLSGRRLPRVFGFFSGTADLDRFGDSEFFFRPPDSSGGTAPLFSDYVRNADRSDPRVSPIYFDLRGFPPTLCIAGTRDFMLSQTALFHQALLRAGVKADLLVYEAMPHAHWIFMDLPESDDAFRAMAAFFRHHLLG